METLFGEDNLPAGGTMGVPIDTTLSTSLAASQVPRATIAQVWAQVKSDLTTAATLLHGQVWTGNDEGRCSEWAAKGLLDELI